MAVITMKQLLEAGVHFGHQTRKWNPKMKKYIFAARNDIHIIDLQLTANLIEEAYAFVCESVKAGKSVLFVGTKKQAQDAIKEEAERCGQYYVNSRWLGGCLSKQTCKLQGGQRWTELASVCFAPSIHHVWRGNNCWQKLPRGGKQTIYAALLWGYKCKPTVWQCTKRTIHHATKLDALLKQFSHCKANLRKKVKFYLPNGGWRRCNLFR